MQARAGQSIEQADLLVLVRDCTDDRPPPPLTRQPDLRVATKLDLSPDARLGADELGISALREWNLEELRRRLDLLAFGQPCGGDALALNARHVQAVQQAREALARALPRVFDQSPELLALELREALDALGSILGTVGPDELLARIFSSFCIGK
jgi:tRNA modification GTPase